jgi:hypothetical protein
MLCVVCAIAGMGLRTKEGDNAGPTIEISGARGVICPDSFSGFSTAATDVVTTLQTAGPAVAMRIDGVNTTGSACNVVSAFMESFLAPELRAKKR